MYRTPACSNIVYSDKKDMSNLYFMQNTVDFHYLTNKV